MKKKAIEGQVEPGVIFEIPYRCPICFGNGLVPNGFYSQTTGQWAGSYIGSEQCRSCKGTGIVWR